MTTISKPMGAVNLIACLAGDLLTDPALLVETIGEDPDLLRIIRSYRDGDFTYEEVLDTIKDYI